MSDRYQTILFAAPPPEAEYPEGFYFSGCGGARELRAVTAAHARGFVSAHRLARSPKLRRLLDKHAGPLALDSGAYSSKEGDAITLDGYRVLLDAWERRFDFVVNLDVLLRDADGTIIGADVPASDRNWRTLRAAGHAVRYVYHPADDPRPMREAAAEAVAAGDSLICVGGLVPLLRRMRGYDESGVYGPPWTGEAEAVNYVMRLGHEALALSEEVGRPIRLHLLGVGSLPVLRCCASEPWFASADATTWIDASKYGRQIATHPFRYGTQEHPRNPIRHPTTNARLHEQERAPSTWHARAVASIRATLLACHRRTRILGPFAENDDQEYFERVAIAERFGCDDETEALAYLDVVLDAPPAYDRTLDGYFDGGPIEQTVIVHERLDPIARSAPGRPPLAFATDDTNRPAAALAKAA